MKITHLKYTIQWFSACSYRCDTINYTVWFWNVSLLPRNLLPLAHSLMPHPYSQWKPLIYILSLWFAYPGHFIQTESHNTLPLVSDFSHTAYCFQCPFSLQHISVLNPFYAQVIFHCVNMMCFIYPFISNGHLGCFHLGTIMEYYAMYKFFWKYVWNSLGYISHAGTARL